MSKNAFTEQELFQMALPRVRKLQKKFKQGIITQEEKAELNDLSWRLFQLVVNFGYGLAHQMTSSFRKDPDMFSELQSELYLEFSKILCDYDPYKSRPTTFFLRPFKGVISRYLAAQSGKTSYDIQNWKKINACIQRLEGAGVDWSIEMISNSTGLSEKVILNTFNIQKRAQLADIDGAYDLKDNIKNPEEEILKREKDSQIARRIKEMLSEQEYRLFCVRVNLDGRKELSFEKTAEKANITLNDAKAIINGAIVKLANDPELCSYLGHSEKRNREKLSGDFPMEEPSSESENEKALMEAFNMLHIDKTVN